MMKTKTKKILAFLAGVVLLVFLLVFASSFLGNPVSWLLARHSAKKRLAEVYSGTDYQLTSVNYNFKEGGYNAQIESPSSMDTYFYFAIDGWGRVQYDSYEYQVLERENTISRLQDQYREMADEVLEASDIPYKLWVAYGDLCTGVDESMEEYHLPAMDTRDLELDGQYDVRELASKYGKLVVGIEDDEITEERAAELILDIKDRMDKAGVPFYWMDFSLQYFRPEEGGGPMKPEQIDMHVVPYDEIRQEDILQKVQQWSKETQEYYERMDNEKEKEFASAAK